MFIQYSDETLWQAAKRHCRERGHDFSHGSHRCWNCNITYLDTNVPTPSFDNDYRFSEGRHIL